MSTAWPSRSSSWAARPPVTSWACARSQSGPDDAAGSRRRSITGERVLPDPSMIQRPTLQVLAEAAEIGLPEAATAPARKFDPLLRPFIRKRVLRAVSAAGKHTTSTKGDHILRLAFLACHESGP